MSTLVGILIFYAAVTVTMTEAKNDSIVLEIDLKAFHFDGKDIRGQDCEIFRRSDCDPYFFICVDAPDGPMEGYLTDLEQCEYYMNKSQIHEEAARSLVFLKDIGTIPLPLKVNISEWKGGFIIKIAVTDSDGGGSIIPNTDDLIDLIEGRFMFDDGPPSNGTKSVLVGKELTGHRGTNRMESTATSYCKPNYFNGESIDQICGVYCLDSDGFTGHYTCNENGTKVCLPGWENPLDNCLNSTDDCRWNQCHAGSTCVDGHFNYTCHCPPGRSGRFCDEKRKTCDDNPCKAFALCVTNKTGHYVCQCKSGKERPGCIVPGIDTDDRNIIDPAPSSDNTGSQFSNNLPLVIGLICGLVALLLIIILLLSVLMSRRRKRRKQKDQSTGASVDTSDAELQAGARTTDAGTATFGNPLYMVSGNQAEPNHYAEVDYSKVKVPLPNIPPQGDYPVKSKAIEAGFVPEVEEHEPVRKKKIPVGGVPVYMNQAGHAPVYDDTYANRGGATGGSKYKMAGGFSPMYSDHDMYRGKSGQFDNPTYDSSLDPDGLEAPNGKFEPKNKSLMFGYEDRLDAKT